MHFQSNSLYVKIVRASEDNKMGAFGSTSFQKHNWGTGSILIISLIKWTAPLDHCLIDSLRVIVPHPRTKAHSDAAFSSYASRLSNSRSSTVHFVQRINRCFFFLFLNNTILSSTVGEWLNWRKSSRSDSRVDVWIGCGHQKIKHCIMNSVYPTLLLQSHTVLCIHFSWLMMLPANVFIGSLWVIIITAVSKNSINLLKSALR